MVIDGDTRLTPGDNTWSQVAGNGTGSAGSPGSSQSNGNHFGSCFSLKRLGVSQEPRGAARVPFLPQDGPPASYIISNTSRSNHHHPSVNLPSFCLASPSQSCAHLLPSPAALSLIQKKTKQNWKTIVPQSCLKAHLLFPGWHASFSVQSLLI